MSNRVTRYLFRVAISIDQLGNTLLGGRPDETISGNVGYNAKQGKPWALKAEKIINFIMRSPTHCRCHFQKTTAPVDWA